MWSRTRSWTRSVVCRSQQRIVFVNGAEVANENGTGASSPRSSAKRPLVTAPSKSMLSR